MNTVKNPKALLGALLALLAVALLVGGAFFLLGPPTSTVPPAPTSGPRPSANPASPEDENVPSRPLETPDGPAISDATKPQVDIYSTEPEDYAATCTTILGKPSEVFARVAPTLPIAEADDLWMAQWEKSPSEGAAYLACVAKSQAATGAGVILLYAEDEEVHELYNFAETFGKQGLVTQEGRALPYSIFVTWPQGIPLEEEPVKAYMGEVLERVK